MSADLRRLLDRAAAEGPPPDPDEIWRAGRRRARRRSLVAGTAVAAMVAAVVAVGTTLAPQRVAIGPAAPTTTAPTAAPTEAATGTATPTTEPSEPDVDTATEVVTEATGLDVLADEGTIGLELAQQAAQEEFHPAMLVGPGTYAWYMTEDGWTERIPAATRRQAAMCAWAADLGMGTGGFHEALNDATVRRYSEIRGADGLPLVVEDVCTTGGSSLWEDGDPPPTGDCGHFAEGQFASDQAVEDCRRHYGQGG